jgi:hypothetical protein
MQKMSYKSFLFVGDPIKLNRPIKLFDDYVLKKPNNKQLEIIRHFINNYVTALRVNNRFETKVSKTKEGGIMISQVQNKTDWNFCIIEKLNRPTEPNLPLVLSLSKLDLTILSDILPMNTGEFKGKKHYYPHTFSHPLVVVNFLFDNNTFEPDIKILNNETVKELRKINTSVEEFRLQEKKFEFIKKALKDFLKLKEISKYSPFKILGYFSIFELLLTTYHARGTNENSLNNQLQKKINLINNQLEKKIDFRAFFKSPDTVTLELVIEKLYKFRNDIAHGNKSDFDKELHILKNDITNILPFLHLLLQKILLKAISEPQFIKDLKSC